MRRFAIFALLAVAGCRTPPNDDGPKKESAPCAKVGDRCEVSPGKLGTCVARDDCKTGNCFVCQSQH